MSNFANKIGLYCNDSNEYLSLFEHTSFIPDEVPGRCILEINKRMIECQSYLAFEGEIEKDRVERIKEFIRTVNNTFANRRAKLIPSIPQILLLENLFSNYKVNFNQYSIPIGLTYEEVNPFYLDISQLGILGLCGKENTGHKNFISYLLNCLENQKNKYPSKVVILDDFSRKFECLKDLSVINQYTLDGDLLLSTINEWHDILDIRYNSLVETGTLGENTALLLLIIQNNDFAKKINDDWDILEKFKDLVVRYKGMNVAIIFTNYQNAVVSFDAPEPLRMIKENQHLIFFEDLSNLKAFDVPYEELKVNKKKLETGDAYYILDGSVTKLKLIKSDFE